MKITEVRGADIDFECSKCGSDISDKISILKPCFTASEYNTLS